jgi:hypothetical protein
MPYFCNCSKYCKSRKQVSKSAYYKHGAHRLADLPDTYHGPVNVPQTTSTPGSGSSSTAGAGHGTREIPNRPPAKRQRQELEDESTASGNGTHRKLIKRVLLTPL